MRMRISRDRDLLTPNGWHRALRRLILHRIKPLLQPSRPFNRKLRLADWHVDKFQISTTKWLLTGTVLELVLSLPLYRDHDATLY